MHRCLFIVCVLYCVICASVAEDCTLSAIPPDPSSGCCGLANGSSWKKNTSMAEIDEFPWMGLVEYKRGYTMRALCSAFLISGQYALSAAHCFINLTGEHGTPVSVRLGEYDISNEGKDCVEATPGMAACNNGTVSIPIEKITTHPNFTRRTKHDDIALIKLAQLVSYTDFIRPICLPTLDVTLRPPKRFYMTVAGWGAVNSSNMTSFRLSNVLRRVYVPFVDMQICSSLYNTSTGRITLTAGQLCAGSKTRDACYGDAGGPLTYTNRNTTEVAGIVSFGPVHCGIDIPGVYTKVFAYKDWILGVIEEDSRTITTASITTPDPGIIYFRN